MRSYDPARPLIGLHIPKCAGSSLKQVVRRWFGWQIHWHYFDERHSQMPQRYQAGAISRLLPQVSGHNVCIYGHFNRTRGFGIEDYYPAAGQFFTIVRDPLSTMLSRYFAAKHQGLRRVRGGQPAPIAERYRSLDDFVADKLREPFFINYLPGPMTLDNYAEIFATQFIYVGVAEDLQTSVDRLAARLGFASTTVPHANRSQHDETLSPAREAEFVQSRSLEYAIYHYALEHYRL